jgi:hypothetical protein
MDQNERHVMTDDLFDRLRKAEEQTEPRDPDPATSVSTAAGLTISGTVPSSS